MAGIDSENRTRAAYSRIQGSRLERVAMAMTIVGGVAGLIWLSSRVSIHGPDLAAEQPEAGTKIEGSEIDEILVPEVLLQLAHDSAAFTALRSHEAIQDFVKRRGLEKAWYALIIWRRQENGRQVKVKTFCRLSLLTWKLEEFRAVLETLASNPPTNPQGDFSAAKITLIPDRLVESDPLDAIDQVLSLSAGTDPVDLRKGQKKSIPPE